MIDKKKILILGGTGFVGKRINFSLKKNYFTKIVSKSLGYDLRKKKTFEKILKNQKYDYIINCAAHVGGLSYLKKFSADIFYDNALIYLNLYNSLKYTLDKPRIINLISNCVYPKYQKIQKEEKIFDGEIHDSVEPFGYSKNILLKSSKFYYNQYSIKSLNLILPNVFGPGDHLDTDRSHALNGIIVRMLNAKKKNYDSFKIWGSGRPKREWIFVNDVSRIVLRCINKKNLFLNFEHINIAQNKSYSINQIAKIVKNKIKFKGKLSNDITFPDGALIKQMNNINFKKNFKLFKFTKFESAISKTIDFYKKDINL